MFLFLMQNWGIIALKDAFRLPKPHLSQLTQPNLIGIKFHSFVSPVK
jgi:hypothetical protein